MIYLDYAATHPMTRGGALAAYAQAAALPGNPASVHGAGQAARERLEDGRARVAAALNTDPRNLIANSGGTEGDNHVVLGMARAWQEEHGSPGHLITTPTEHSAVLAPARWLAAQGWAVTFLAPDPHGRYIADQLAEALRPDTALISIHHANNELGTVQDTPALAAVAAARGVPYHSDAVQAPGVLPMDVAAVGRDLRHHQRPQMGRAAWRGLRVRAARHGAACHHAGRRAGRRPAPRHTGHGGRVRGGCGPDPAEAQREATFAHLSGLRERFLERVSGIPDLRVNHPPEGSPKVVSVTLPGADGEALLMNLDMLGVAASAGSACSRRNHAAQPCPDRHRPERMPTPAPACAFLWAGHHRGGNRPGRRSTGQAAAWSRG